MRQNKGKLLATARKVLDNFRCELHPVLLFRQATKSRLHPINILDLAESLLFCRESSSSSASSFFCQHVAVPFMFDCHVYGALMSCSFGKPTSMSHRISLFVSCSVSFARCQPVKLTTPKFCACIRSIQLVLRYLFTSKIWQMITPCSIVRAMDPSQLLMSP